MYKRHGNVYSIVSFEMAHFFYFLFEDQLAF